MEQKRALIPKVPVSIPKQYKDVRIYGLVNADKWINNPHRPPIDISEKPMNTIGGIWHGYPDTRGTTPPTPVGSSSSSPDTKTLILVTVACLAAFYFLSKYTDV